LQNKQVDEVVVDDLLVKIIAKIEIIHEVIMIPNAEQNQLKHLQL
jgi:hypothetical protein